MICYAISHYKIINFIANYLFVNILIYMIIYQTQVALLSDLLLHAAHRCRYRII